MLKLLVPSSAKAGKSAEGKSALLVINNGGLEKVQLGEVSFDYKANTMNATIKFTGVPFKYVNDSLVLNSMKQLELTSIGKAAESIANLYDEFDKLMTDLLPAPATPNVGEPKQQIKTDIPKPPQQPKVSKAPAPTPPPKEVKEEAPAIEIDEKSGGMKELWGISCAQDASIYDKAWVLGYLTKADPPELFIMGAETVPGDESSNLYLFFHDQQQAKEFFRRALQHQRHKLLLGLDAKGNSKYEPLSISTVVEMENLKDVEVHVVNSAKKFLQHLEAAQIKTTA
jgi:hypothetical protein